uniref:LIM zinc-binding domain-containing protein n=1 Tax=Anopheles atroparvus TaxID=41427 RepID=A0A182IZX9_ANOAO
MIVCFNVVIEQPSPLYENNHYHEECLRCNSCGLNLTGPNQKRARRFKCRCSQILQEQCACTNRTKSGKDFDYDQVGSRHVLLGGVGSKSTDHKSSPIVCIINYVLLNRRNRTRKEANERCDDDDDDDAEQPFFHRLIVGNHATARRDNPSFAEGKIDFL